MGARTAARALALAAALAAPAARAQDAERAHVDAEHGFRLELPDASWSFRTGREPGALAVLRLAREGDPEHVGLKLTVQRSDDLTRPEDVRAAALQLVEGRAEYTDVLLEERRVGGRDAPGLSLRVALGEQELLLRQAYVVEDGLRYLLQDVAPAAEAAERRGVYDALWEGFALVPRPPPDEEEALVAELAARCGSEVDWAADWAEAAERARSGKRLVVVTVHFLAGFDLEDPSLRGPFMDPDVVALVNERCVPLRLGRAMDAPFRDPDVYGMSATTFGDAILFVTPEGEVVGEAYSEVDGMLRDALARRPELTGAPVPEGLDALDEAEVRQRRGELGRAAELLAEPRTARGHRLRAALLRRERDGEGALAALERAARAPGGAELAADLAVDRARVLLGLARPAVADEVLRPLVGQGSPLDGERAPEAAFLLALAEQDTEGLDAARARWRALLDSHPESRWAWLAAAVLESPRIELGLPVSAAWPDPAVRAALARVPREPLPPEAARRAEREALAALLAAQRPDGTWVDPTETRSADGRPSEFVVAVTALCGESLLARRGDERVDAAVRRALDGALAVLSRARELGDEAHYMDYVVWRAAALLELLAGCAEAGVAERAELAPAVAGAVEDLRARQQSGGGFSYYVTSELGGDGDPAHQSISFTTAAATLGLLRARDAGFEVPEELLSRALDCLERMRRPDGTFVYFLWHDAEGRDLPGREGGLGAAGDAGRGPLCTLALVEGGRLEAAALGPALDLFLEHRGTLTAELGKLLMHAGREGQGSHYVLFDHRAAARAVRRLPEGERGAYRLLLLETLLAARRSDGTYVDNPLTGPAFGTAMALGALQDLAPLP